MKVKFIDGCTSYDAYFDRTPMEFCSPEELKANMSKVFERILELNKPELYTEIINDWIQADNDELETDYCDECGDTIYNYYKEI